MHICFDFSWNALSAISTSIAAISTTAAVIVALFIPRWQYKKKLIAIDNALQKELEDSFLIIKDAKNISAEKITLPPGFSENERSSFSLEMKIARLRALDSSFWPQSRIEATILDESKYIKYRECFKQISEVKEIASAEKIEMKLILDYALDTAMNKFKDHGFK